MRTFNNGREDGCHCSTEKANSNLTFFETFRCLTQLWKFLGHPKRPIYFVKERNSDRVGQGKSTEQAKAGLGWHKDFVHQRRKRKRERRVVLSFPPSGLRGRGGLLSEPLYFAN